MHNAPRTTVGNFDFKKFCFERKQERVKAKEDCAKVLTDAGIKFQSRSNGGHLLVQSHYGLIDLFILNEKWIIRQTEMRGNGTKKLVDFITTNQ